MIEKTTLRKDVAAGQPNFLQKRKFDGKSGCGSLAQRSNGGFNFPLSGTCGRNHPSKCHIINRGYYECASYDHVIKDYPRRQQ